MEARNSAPNMSTKAADKIHREQTSNMRIVQQSSVRDAHLGTDSVAVANESGVFW